MLKGLKGDGFVNNQGRDTMGSYPIQKPKPPKYFLKKIKKKIIMPFVQA
jgi:hypothetical protein